MSELRSCFCCMRAGPERPGLLEASVDLGRLGPSDARLRAYLSAGFSWGADNVGLKLWRLLVVGGATAGGEPWPAGVTGVEGDVG